MARMPSWLHRLTKGVVQYLAVVFVTVPAGVFFILCLQLTGANTVSLVAAVAIGLFLGQFAWRAVGRRIVTPQAYEVELVGGPIQKRNLRSSTDVSTYDVNAVALGLHQKRKTSFGREGVVRFLTDHGTLTIVGIKERYAPMTADKLSLYVMSGQVKTPRSSVHQWNTEKPTITSSLAIETILCYPEESPRLTIASYAKTLDQNLVIR